ncbi:putative glycerophosphoryl diester phosphodiesterase [Actinoplanes missouriensis 431]|uniref:Putative glycerophosphoryl diester phosphodiesterase n=1 Tax=Actinoplanes missouriensis (strain ATCC 14538 / DSM 43046 / CBS 188.64 / JCM 3121 / NBRC 102363 / NCIMB 12654 / NRRL B-3342 / UNCC 431) TaxID=512565 RepID=I0HGI0_ACTM4|nr:glycerophosphodiester phosphodiesterase family protein [Actinoplanes missouriensis]BAL92117.1 putative glycerophosphoryl diester phosphodiesterase [Actinoplanes missouriensis 431]
MLHRVAHRGYAAAAPENTLPAFEAAVRAGATIVEFDVRVTADGVPVVIHDRTVDRTTTGRGRVWDLRWDEIAELDAGVRFSPAFAGARVPSLAEVLDLLRPAPPELLVEIKSPATLDEVKTVIAELASRDLVERTVVQSFDPDVLRKAREIAPELRRGLLLFRFDAETVSQCRDLGVALCNPSVVDVLQGAPVVAELAAVGVGVMPWTANDRAHWGALVEAGAAGLITDYVGELTGWSTP